VYRVAPSQPGGWNQEVISLRDAAPSDSALSVAPDVLCERKTPPALQAVGLLKWYGNTGKGIANSFSILAPAAEQGEEADGSEEGCGWFRNCVECNGDSCSHSATIRSVDITITTGSCHITIGHKHMLDLTQRLVEHGHRRIVLLTASGSKPKSFIKGLESNGIEVGDFNLPAMERTPEGVRRCLDSLFSLTPPTALLIDEPILFLSVQSELANRGIFAPKDISLISLDSDPAYKWYSPSVAHIHCDMAPVSRRIIRWVMNVSRGKVERKTVYTNSVFVDGGTMGAVPMDGQTKQAQKDRLF